MKKFNFSQTYTNITRRLDQDYDGFVANVVAKAQTPQFVTIVPDVKYAKEVPLIDVTGLVFSDATTEITSLPLTQGATTSIASVNLVAKYLRTQETFNINQMEQYYFSYVMDRGSDTETLPFEDQFIAQREQHIAKQLDILFWQGNTGLGITGAYQIAASASAVGITASSFSTSTAVTNGIINTLNAMYAAAPADLKSSENIKIAIGKDAYDTYVQSVVNINNFHLKFNEFTGTSFFLPGNPLVEVYWTAGLNATNKAVLYKKEFLFWGTDILPDAEPVKVSYESLIDAILMRYKVKLAVGLGFAPNCVIATSASTL
jgi:hypothetical protein